MGYPINMTQEPEETVDTVSTLESTVGIIPERNL